MLFSSYEYILIFLPVSVIAYYALARVGYAHVARAWLVVCSLVFYAWGDARFLPMLLGSLALNYWIGSAIARRGASSKWMLASGIAVNLAGLGYFKYTGFFMDTLNTMAGTGFEYSRIWLPIGISFFTFQQIAYLVDMSRADGSRDSFMDYALFVTFFPKLLAGPIVRRAEFMPQLSNVRILPDYDNLSRGLYVFMLGLFKKVAIADYLALYVGRTFDGPGALTLLEAWGASLSYTFQLYFDFSGYTDMAIGAALMLNIALPVNFDSPYKALDIREFWRRWHITLSNFIRDYIYFPLGGSRASQARTLVNLMITFALCGLWHGAGWTFVLWGAAHGIAMCINRLWMRSGLRLNRALAWLVTFNFINLTWVLFRARDFASAAKVYAGMFGLSGVAFSEKSRWLLGFMEAWGAEFTSRSLGSSYLNLSIALVILALMTNNTGQMMRALGFRLRSAAFAALLGAYAILNMGGLTEFLYFKF